MKLLHIDSGILGTASVSRQLSAEAVAEWRARHPNTEVVYRDLVAQPLPISPATSFLPRAPIPASAARR